MRKAVPLFVARRSGRVIIITSSMPNVEFNNTTDAIAIMNNVCAITDLISIYCARPFVVYKRQYTDGAIPQS